MEERGGGGGGEGDGGVVIGRRITLLDQMSAVQDRRDPLAGLTLDAILTNKRPSPPRAPAGRTLLDIIRDEDPNGKNFGHKDRKSWKLFRDRLRLKRAGAAWTSSVRIPTSDIPIPSSSLSNSNPRSQLIRRSSVRFQTNPAGELASQLEDNRGPPPQFARRPSSKVASSSPGPTQSSHHEDSPEGEGSPTRSSRQPQLSRHNSTRVEAASNTVSEDNSVDPFDVAREGTRRLAVVLAQERQLSAREAVAAQEAAEAEAAAAEAEAEAEAEASVQVEAEAEAAEPVQPRQPRMSLMDLLEETDRQMGLEGSRYAVGEDEDEEEEDEAEAEAEGEYEEEGDDVEENAGGIEHNCCVCMVRHKGAAFIPCGHTFCRLCSRELWVQRGNCPLCNGFILEILDIF